MLSYRNDVLYVEDVPLPDVAARYGTPGYVYSRAALTAAWVGLDAALAGHPHQICYAVKANSNLGVLGVFAALGSGFDIVSIGELERVLCAGAIPERVVFAGVGKRRDEIARALEVGVGCINVESEPELLRIADVARAHGVRAPVAVRVNPDVDAETHPYIATGLKKNKFGVPFPQVRSLYLTAAEDPALAVRGISCHIGSQLLSTGPFRDALARVLELVDELTLAGIDLDHVDMGGGLGIRYRDETPPQIHEYAATLLAGLAGRRQKLVLEPGRYLVGNAGLLLTRIEYLKRGEERNFAICDAAMNDLIRPSLYSAWQEILPVQRRADIMSQDYDVVGPVCETGDFLGHQRSLAVMEDDLLAIASAGAYGFVMASNYNTRPRPPELMIDGSSVHLVRERESIAGLMQGERLLPA